MASAEEIALLIERTVQAVLSGLQSTALAGNRGGRRILDAKGMSRVETFGGNEAQWREWAFQSRVAIKAMHNDVAGIMAKVEVEEDGHKLEDLELEFCILRSLRLQGNCVISSAYASKETHWCWYRG